jgi:hypothetical protein
MSASFERLSGSISTERTCFKPYQVLETRRRTYGGGSPMLAPIGMVLVGYALILKLSCRMNECVHQDK